MKFINLYNIIIESRLNDYKLQLKDQQLAKSIFSLNNPKKQKMIIKWIKNKSIKYPDDLQLIDKVYQIIQRKQLDYNNYDNPNQILNQFEQLSNQLDYNPDYQSYFSNKVQLGKGVIVYNVQNDIEGQLAVRKAVDYNWGKDANPWCLVNFDDGEDEAWKYWNNYNAIQKRICFKNNKLIAFCANNELEILWWDREDNPKTLKEIVGVQDDSKAIKEVQKLKNTLIYSKESKDSKQLQQIYQNYKDNNLIKQNLVLNPNTPSNILQKLSNDKDFRIRCKLASNSNCPINILQKLTNDNDFFVRYKVASNPNCPSNILQKLADDNDWVRMTVASNPNTPINILQKLSEDINYNVRYEVASNPNCPKEILQKLANDEDSQVRGIAEQKLNKYNVF